MKRLSFARTVSFAVPLCLLFLAAASSPCHAQLEVKLQQLQESIKGLYDGSPVTLDECLKVAKVGSTALGVYEENLAAAKSDRTAAKAQWLPDLSASASWNRSERTDFDVADYTNSTVIPGQPIVYVDQNGNLLPLDINGTQAYEPTLAASGTSNQTILQTFKSASLSTNWTVFDGFGRISRIKESKATVRAAEADLGYQEKVLVQDVSEAFYNVLRAQKQVEVAKETQDVAKQELDRSKTYFDVGIATKSDVLQAQVRYKQTQLDVVRARNSERQSFVLLTHFMNIPGAERFELADDLPAEISSIELPKFSDLLQEARQDRLDLKSAQENLQASGYAITQAHSGYFPQLAVFGQASLSQSETPYRFGAQKNRQYSWGARLSWNLFDRFQTRNRSRQALAAKRRAEYNLRQSELTMESELSGFLNNLIEAKESFQVASETIDQAEEDLRLASERFKVGAGTSLDVINAQQSLAQARGDAVNAVADFYIARAKIDRATGR